MNQHSKVLILSLFLIGITYSQESVDVHFSEWMDTLGMSNPDNFIWDNGLITLSAELIDTATCRLVVTDPIINLWYLVEVFNVFDLAGNIVNPEKDTASYIWTPVPVELVSFTVKIITLEYGYDVLVQWETATEINNYGFEIERDGEVIAFIEGHGNSNSPKKYVYVDTSVRSGEHKYKLKQIDNDGTYEYSVELSINIGEVDILTLYPNPTTRQFCLVIHPLIKGERVKLYSVTGQLMGDYEMLENKLYVTQSLPSGVYIIKYGKKTTKLIIVK